MFCQDFTSYVICDINHKACPNSILSNLYGIEKPSRENCDEIRSNLDEIKFMLTPVVPGLRRYAHHYGKLASV